MIERQHREAAKSLSKIGGPLATTNVTSTLREQMRALDTFAATSMSASLKDQFAALSTLATTNVTSTLREQMRALDEMFNWSAPARLAGIWSDSALATSSSPSADAAQPLADVTDSTSAEAELIARFWSWWVNLTPEDRAVHNQMAAVVLALLFFVAVFTPNRTVLALLSAASLVHNVLLLLSAIENRRRGES